MSYKNNMLVLVFFCVSLLCRISDAKSFVLAAIYSPDRQLVSCIKVLQAVIKKADKEGLNIRLVKMINYNNSSVGALRLALKARSMRVDAVIGGGSSEQMLLVSKVLNSSRIPLLVLTAEHPSITKNKPYVIALLPNLNLFCESVANKMLNDLPKAKRILIIRNISMQYAVYVSNRVSRIIKKSNPGAKISYVNIINGYECVHCLVDEIRRNHPDLVYLPIYNTQISSLLIGLAKQSFPVHVFINAGNAALNEMKYYRLILRKHPGISLHIFTVWSGKPSGNYSSLYNTVIQNGGVNDLKVALTFDAIELLVKRLSDNSNARGMDLVDLIKSRRFFGVTGAFWFDKYGNTMKAEKERFFYYVIQSK